jgi:tetraacyldisaccharide 4'-kinase
MIAQRVPGAIVVVDADRSRAGQWAIEQLQPDVFVLDDGFQHRQLHRDLDIVTFKGDRSLGNGWLLPAGPLREPVENLERSHLFWHNQAQGKHLDVGVIKPVITTGLSYEGFYNKDGQVLELGKKLRVLAFCGLANPQDFAASLQAHGFEIVRLVHFKDHYYYRHRDIQELEAAKERSRADLVITTQKDWVKLALDYNLPSHWYCLHIAVQPENSQRADEILGNLCSGIF